MVEAGAMGFKAVAFMGSSTLSPRRRCKRARDPGCEGLHWEGRGSGPACQEQWLWKGCRQDSSELRFRFTGGV